MEKHFKMAVVVKAMMKKGFSPEDAAKMARLVENGQLKLSDDVVKELENL